MTITLEQLNEALETDMTLRKVSKHLGVSEKALSVLVKLHGVDIKSRTSRIVSARAFEREAKVRAKLNKPPSNWLRNERTMSGDMSSLLGLRTAWI